MQTTDSEIKDEVFVDEYTGGLVGPSLGFAATIKDGGHIRCVVPPGCWGPMITPEFHGGHEVTRAGGCRGSYSRRCSGNYHRVYARALTGNVFWYDGNQQSCLWRRSIRG